MATDPPHRVLVFGATGQVGREACTALSGLGEVIPLDRHDADLGDPPSLRGIVAHHSPTVVVNAAAYTAVDRAESEPVVAETVNAVAPGTLADATQALGACMVHYSSDYVFDGRNSSPYVETDPTNPLSVYGRTKALGEQAVEQRCARHLIIRTSWVYAAHGTNFLRTMLRLAAERDTLRVVDDQHGAPTPAALVARVTASILAAMLKHEDGGRWGVYHLAPAGFTTWHGYARYIVQRARALGMPLRTKPECVEPISSAEYPTAAARPPSSRLDTSKLRRTFGVDLPDWTDGVDGVLHELMGDLR